MHPFILMLIVVGSIAVYATWLRPILKTTPALRELFAREATAWAAVRAKFAGIKQKLTGALVIIAGVIVELHDQLAPVVAGVDVSALTQRVPSWAWPLIVIAVTLLLQWFRELADRRNVGGA
jgi:hypothetical protein